MKFITEAIRALNTVGTNVWAIFCLLLGALCLVKGKQEGGLMIIGGGLALLRGSHAETATPPPAVQPTAK